MPSVLAPFATRVIAWQRANGRNNLPWQNTRDPYLIWLSEIMLQQTQVSAVVPYFTRFLARFPTLETLARASADDVLAQWAGLGYYARARNLHRAAQQIIATFDGAFPSQPAQIETLPGIGRSTANAIAAFAFGVNAPILDGNVKRVLARHAAVEGYPGTPRVEAALWDEAHARQPSTPQGDAAAKYTQGMMDLGALCCTRRSPKCDTCPVAHDCRARREGRVEELPAPRPSKPLPQRVTTFAFVVAAGNRLLLETRASPGIWGGLSCLPEWTQAFEKMLENALKIPSAQIQRTPLAPIQHAFTHFRLQIEPIAVVFDAPVAFPAHRNLRWVDGKEALDALGFPAPIKRFLLSRYDQTRDTFEPPA